ncbi:hypothetical protein [Halomonas sp. CKK8]|uniref:hypothetical protein n=1 Tax=Halomonas sp. CKK8 TaxID=3036127 RepID=UPI0024158BD2|nr:hypothetical protein [Halomonas sp. CKK8]WFM72662.1 hypothetical protein P8934_06630 [Halomonas sp. CKK8]
MVVKLAKKIVKSYVRKTGFEIKRVASDQRYDLCRHGSHPVEAVYASQGEPCLVEVPLSRIITFGYSAFPLAANAGHPFVKTLEEYRNDREMVVDSSPLRKFYELYQPRTAAEFMGLGQPSYSRFETLPALAAPPLWAWDSPEEYCRHIKGVHQAEDKEQRGSSDKFIGGSQFGPVENDKLEIEFRRLTKLYESIERYGYRPEKCDWMTGVAWVGESEWVIVISTGQHRLACLAVLGYESAAVHLQPVKAPAGLMMRSNHRHFPSVVNSYHTAEEARTIFDRMMSRRQPEAAREWLSFCQAGRAPVVSVVES